MSTLSEQVIEALKTDFDEVYEAGFEKGQSQGGGSGEVGGITQYVKTYATPQLNNLFTIVNPLGGLAKKVSITCPQGSPTESTAGMIQKYSMDTSVGLGAMHYIHATNGSIACSGSRQESTANTNARFAILEGKIEAKSYASSNGMWDVNCEYEIEIWQ